MKNVVRFLVVLSLTTASFVFTRQPAKAVPQLEDRWLRDAPGYERALQLQRELGVPLVVYFYTDWCQYCRALDSQYLHTQQVQQYLKGVVKVRINPDDGRAEREIEKRYGVTGYPAFLVIRTPSSLPTNVNPFRTRTPNLTPAQFVSACQRGLSSSGRVSLVGVNRKAIPSARSAAATTTKGPIVRTASIANADQPTPSWILNRYAQAIGGRDAVARITSRVAKGRIDIAGVSFGGRLETFAKAPNMFVTVMNTESTGILKRGFDGRTSWMISNQKGFHNPSPMELATLAAEADFYREIKLKELYSRISLVGTGPVGTREAYIVEATPRIGAAEKLYFDVETGLLMRRDAMSAGSRGLVRAEFYFSDWRLVDGVRIPFKTTELTPSATYIFTLEEVKHNVALDEGIFRQP